MTNKTQPTQNSSSLELPSRVCSPPIDVIFSRTSPNIYLDLIFRSNEAMAYFLKHDIEALENKAKITQLPASKLPTDQGCVRIDSEPSCLQDVFAHIFNTYCETHPDIIARIQAIVKNRLSSS